MGIQNERSDDVFGQVLWDHLQTGARTCEFIEREDGYIDVGALGSDTYFAEYCGWPEIESNLIALARGRILDIGCGAGRHALYLQAQGLDVTGIDNSPLAIEVCRQRGLKQARLLSTNDIEQLSGPFNTILLLGHNLGLLSSFNLGRELLRKLQRLTSDDALVLATTLDPYQTTNPHHLAYHQRNRDVGRLGGQIRFRVRYRTLIGAWFDYLFASKPELESIVAGTGWQVREYVDGKGPSYGVVLHKR